jgi:hypothetical protein
MEYPSTEEILEEMEPEMPDDYREKLESSVNQLSSALAAVAVYLDGGGRKNIREAYRIGNLIGINTRIVDDIMDGEEIPQVEDREKFLENCAKSIEGEEVEPVEHEAEEAAYTTARITGELLDRGAIAAYLRDVRDLAPQEDKSTVEGYKQYSRGISATIGEIIGVSLGELEDFEPTTENLSASYDLAYLGQIADDRMDGDTGLGDDVEEFHDEAVQRIKKTWT